MCFKLKLNLITKSRWTEKDAPCVSQAQVEAKKEHEGAVHLLEVSVVGPQPVGEGGGEGGGSGQYELLNCVNALYTFFCACVNTYYWTGVCLCSYRTTWTACRYFSIFFNFFFYYLFKHPVCRQKDDDTPLYSHTGKQIWSFNSKLIENVTVGWISSNVKSEPFCFFVFLPLFWGAGLFCPFSCFLFQSKHAHRAP